MCFSLHARTAVVSNADAERGGDATCSLAAAVSICKKDVIMEVGDDVVVVVLLAATFLATAA